MLKEKVDEYYLKKRKARERKSFYVTDVAECPRVVYFSFKNFPKKEHEPRILRVMHNGDFVHQRMGNVLTEMKVLEPANTEIPIPENDLFRGRADAIIEIEGEKYVVDFKSANTYTFRSLQAPKPEHIKQVQLYMHYLGIKKGLLFYECKNTQDIKEFPVDYDVNIVNEIIQEFYLLKSKIENNIVPDIPAWIEQWKCERCPFLESCKKIGNPYFKNTED
ncbi:MAG: PD-(D/E)XK nuclease family protein [Nanoarchaeota archaeon]